MKAIKAMKAMHIYMTHVSSHACIALILSSGMGSSSWYRDSLQRSKLSFRHWRLQPVNSRRHSSYGFECRPLALPLPTISSERKSLPGPLRVVESCATGASFDYRGAEAEVLLRKSSLHRSSARCLFRVPRASLLRLLLAGDGHHGTQQVHSAELTWQAEAEEQLSDCWAGCSPWTLACACMCKQMHEVFCGQIRPVVESSMHDSNRCPFWKAHTY